LLLAGLIGFIAAFCTSMPVAGPVAAIIVRRAIGGRYQGAFMVAVGSGVAESIYAFSALWGFSTYLSDYPIVLPLSKLLAALILIILGLFFTRHHTTEEEAAATPPKDSRWGSFGVGFTLTIINPTLIATWTAGATMVFSAEIIDFEPPMSFPFAVGVAAGTAAWFAFLIMILRRLKHSFSQHALDRVIRFMGWALVCLGIWFIWVFARYFLYEV
jgi:threonine/homoserine/homoserine lactone efflux protein